MLTVALTGQLGFILAISAVSALIFSYLLLRLYRRTVIKSMRRRSRSEILELVGFLPPEPEHKPNDAPLSFDSVTRDKQALNRNASTIYRRATRRRWLIAFIHAVAGCCFAATMTAAFLTSRKMAFLSFLSLTWVNAWPIVVAVDLAIALSRRGRIVTASAYFLIGAIIVVFALAKNLGLPIGQLLYVWLGSNAPATLLLFIFLNRRIRAVGPLVLVFMVLSVTGASLIFTLTGHDQRLLKTISDFSFSVGLSATTTRIALHMIGFAVFAVVAWIILGVLRRLYESKSISEQSITIDAVWLLFGIVNSSQLALNGPGWIVSGLVAFMVYKLIAAGLFRACGSSRRAHGYRLLTLRVFALGKRSESVYDTLGKWWRTVGSIQLIAGPDLATSAVEPHEFLDFVSGKLDRRFIDSGRTLDLRISHMDLEPDREGQFRVTEFFCHEDTWKMTLGRLADESDAVLMDLRGLSPANAGCVSEIHEMLNVVPLSRVVFAIDDTTDQFFLRRTMREAWAELKDRSPNYRLPAGQVSLVELSGMSMAGFHNLLFALSAAATAKL